MQHSVHPRSNSAIMVRPKPIMPKRLLEIRQQPKSSEIQAVGASLNHVPESLASTASKASAFWTHKGMDTFFDWITNPVNNERLYKKNPVSGQKTKDLHKEIAALVNRTHNVQWTPAQVKSKIAYTRTKYREAARLKSTGEGSNVVFRQLEICPLFQRLHEVYGGSLLANLPPPRQTTRLVQEYTLSVSSGEETSDLENIDESDDHSDTQTTRGTVRGASEDRSSKRRKFTSGSSGHDISSTMDMILKISRQQGQTYDETRAELRRRELVIEQRERELTDKLLKRAEDSHDRLRKELESARAAFRAEMEQERMQLRKEREIFEQKKEDFEQKKEDFVQSKEELYAGLAVLCSNLERIG
ncbi:hypothetical protein BGZ94_008625 [Podila epigama]|nr:hypothetical protein BGZ94_008625 [Podila epigama]